MLLCSFYLKYNSSLVFSVQILLKVEYWNYFLLLYFYVFLPSHALLILNIYMLQIFFLLYILGFKIICLIQIETFIETEFIWFGVMLLWMFLCFTDTHLSQFFSWIMQFNNCCPKGIIQFLLVLWEFCTMYFNHIYSPTTIPPRSSSFPTHPFSSSSLFKNSYKDHFFSCSLIIECVAFHWSIVNLPGDISQNKTDSPFSRISSSYDRGEPSYSPFLSMLSFGLDQGGFIKEIQVWFNIQKSTNEIYLIKTQEQKVYNHFIGYKERPLKKPKDPSSWKCWTWESRGTGDISLHNKINIQEVHYGPYYCHFAICFQTLLLPSWQVLLALYFDSLYHFSSIMAFCYYCEL